MAAPTLAKNFLFKNGIERQQKNSRNTYVMVQDASYNLGVTANVHYVYACAPNFMLHML